MTLETNIGGLSGAQSTDVSAYDGANIGIMSDGTVQSIGSYSSFNFTGMTTAAVAVGTKVASSWTRDQMDMMLTLAQLQSHLSALQSGPNPNAHANTIQNLQGQINDLATAISLSMGGGGYALDAVSSGFDALDNAYDEQSYMASDSSGAQFANFLAQLASNFTVTQSYGARGVPTLQSLQVNGSLLYPVHSYANPNQPALPQDVLGSKGVFHYGTAQLDIKATSTDAGQLSASGSGVVTRTGTGKINRLIPVTSFGTWFSDLINPATNLMACSMSPMAPYPGGIKWKPDGLYNSANQKIAISPNGGQAGDGVGRTIRFARDGIYVNNTRFTPMFLPSAIRQGFLCAASSDPVNGLTPGYDLTNSLWFCNTCVNLMTPDRQTISFYLPCMPGYNGTSADNALVNSTAYVAASGQGGGSEGASW